MPSKDAQTGEPPRLSWRRKVLFALVPLLALLLVGELVARLVRAPLHFGSFRALRVDLLSRGYPAERHPVLGYAPKAGFAGCDNHWGTRVTIDAGGCRSNGRPASAPPLSGRPILAVGDSFTFGDQVHDDESWPAQLEQRLRRPVTNGGVFGYSFAQTVLRAEELLTRIDAEWTVVSVIAGDIERLELSKRYTPLPWFDVVDGALVQHDVPAHTAEDPADRRDRAFKDLLGHSALLDALLANTMKEWWVTNQLQTVVHPREKGAEIALLLLDRLQRSCAEHHTRLLLVLQDKRGTPATDALLARARARGVPTLDLVTAAADEGLLEGERYFDGHMTALGNAWVADKIAAVVDPVVPTGAADAAARRR